MPPDTPVPSTRESAARRLSRCLDCDAAIMSGAAEKPCPVSGAAHRWDHGRAALAAPHEYVYDHRCVRIVDDKGTLCLKEWNDPAHTTNEAAIRADERKRCADAIEVEIRDWVFQNNTSDEFLSGLSSAARIVRGGTWDL